MAPLIVLSAVTLTARGIGWLGIAYLDSWPDATALGLAAMFVLTGISHFVPGRRNGLIAIVPPVLPRPAVLVTLTGLLELVGAAALLVPYPHGPYRAVAAWGVTALLVAMFPANVYAAGARRSATAPTTALLPRTILQCLFIAAALLVALS
ncbi:DoxX family protein [Nocardioides houyundeii]|uniref:DoxX family protein n=1 Tax=Nocardioides houyundeii TaxID=2045452 RepID=UPI000C770C48|nr:hypothetical protein [Nocardioides houyundeii]